jgi:drug/metabolite transporter (DMT)-like permease
MAPPSPTPAKPPALTEYLLLLLLSTLWGSSFTFMKLAVETIPPLTMIAIRGVIAAVCLYVIMRLRGLELPRTLKAWQAFATQGALSIVLPFVLIAWGIQYVDATLGVILNSTTPIFAFLITWAITRHEPATFRKLMGLAIGLAGVLTIMGSDALHNLGAQLLPQASLVAGALCYAISAIYGGQSFRGQHPLVPATGSLIIGTLALIPPCLLLENPWAIWPTERSVIGLICLALLSTASGTVLYFRLLSTLGSLSATSQAYLRVPIGVLVGVVVLGEQLTWSAAAGLVCVVIGVATMTLPQQTIEALLNRLDWRRAA